MDYVVKTEVFEGPFDLLLHLIARQRVDLWQVSLSRITEDYLAEIKRMRELNLEVATEFLVVAATLLELKAARLLPSPDADGDEVEDLLEQRDLLFARLLSIVLPQRRQGIVYFLDQYGIFLLLGLLILAPGLLAPFFRSIENGIYRLVGF